MMECPSNLPYGDYIVRIDYKTNMRDFTRCYYVVVLRKDSTLVSISPPTKHFTGDNQHLIEVFVSRKLSKAQLQSIAIENVVTSIFNSINNEEFRR